MIDEELIARKLPALDRFENGTEVTADTAAARRKELVEILERELFGKMPPLPDGDVTAEVLFEDHTRCCAGKGIRKDLRLSFSVGGKVFSFPVVYMIPKSERKVPLVVIPNFRENVPDEYIPAEELIDRGIGFATFMYKNVTSDDNDFTNGLAGVFYPDGERKSPTDCGKISMWAYAASRVLDYLAAFESDAVDLSRVAVAGHSRLGKTALWAGATDERFACAFASGSGCSGASLARGTCENGETVKAITERFPYWFCENYFRYADKEESMPFDQHFLIAANAPRRVYISDGVDDVWADPFSEYLSCHAAGKMWKLFGKQGFAGDDRIPVPGDGFADGDIGFHLRNGGHYFSRYDWNRFLDFFLG